MRLSDVERSVRAWLDRARGDLQYVAFGIDRPDLIWGTCFHAQQAAEKALKGYLLWLGAEVIPRTHDLHRLARLIVEQGGQQPEEEMLRFLNTYAVECRYPEGMAEDEVTLEAAHCAAGYAREIVAFVRNALVEDETEE